MTERRLTEIRTKANLMPKGWVQTAVLELLTEIERLQAENDKLTGLFDEPPTQRSEYDD